jgi:hypothetical protein
MRRPDAALLILVGSVVQALVGDGWLIRNDREPITRWLRTPGGIAFQVTLLLHSLNVLGRYDPFRYSAARVPRS